MEDTVMKKLESRMMSKEIPLKFGDGSQQSVTHHVPSPPTTGKKVLSRLKPQPVAKVSQLL